MYDLYQSFGLFKKGDRRSDMRAYANFSRHQNFFGNRDDEMKRYDEVIEIIDVGKVFSKEERRAFFYKYEKLYTALMTVPVFTELSRKEIQKRYATHILPRLIALDIFKTYPLIMKIAFITTYTYSYRKSIALAGMIKKRGHILR